MIDLTKPVRRKSDSELVRILATDVPSPPIAFNIAHPIIIATSSGWIERKTFSDMDQDFENIPEDRFFWLNVYDTTVSFWNSREEADKFGTSERKFLLKLNTRTGETTIERKF